MAVNGNKCKQELRNNKAGKSRRLEEIKGYYILTLKFSNTRFILKHLKGLASESV